MNNLPVKTKWLAEKENWAIELDGIVLNVLIVRLTMYKTVVVQPSFHIQYIQVTIDQPENVIRLYL